MKRTKGELIGEVIKALLILVLGGGLVCLGLCALLYLLMKLLTVGTVKLCKWVWIGIKSLFVGKKTKEETVK